MSTTCRTNSNKPLELIVETISIALSDVFNESYGCPNPRKATPKLRSSRPSTGDSTVIGPSASTDTDGGEGTGTGTGDKVAGISIKDIKHLTYECSDISFVPQTCTWIGKVSYKCSLVMKASKTDEKVRTPYAGSFLFTVALQKVKCGGLLEAGYSNTPSVRHNVFSHDNDIREGEEWTPSMDGSQDVDDSTSIPYSPTDTSADYAPNSSSTKDYHYCADIEAILGGEDDEDIRVEYDRHVLKIISQTLIHVGYDVSRALYWLDLPDFPEGCTDHITFRSVYQLNAKIKSGAFATVCLGTHRATKKKIAVKCVHRKNLPPSDDVAIHSEVSILGSLRHQYICPIIDFFMEDECYYIVMDLMEGGDVFDRIGALEYYDESIARDLCRKMLRAIAFCHRQNVAHCDLKPKNLLLKDKDDDASVMLADFGFATTVYSPKTLTKQCGTPYFVAPEILLRQPYDQQADMWSVGVIIYCILSGQLPFTGKRHLDLFKAIIAGDFRFGDGWEEVSDDAKDLINKLLVTDPDKRYTAVDALRSKWIRANDGLLRRNSLVSASSRLKTFNARLKLKTAILVCQSMSRWRKITKTSKSEKDEEGEK